MTENQPAETDADFEAYQEAWKDSPDKALARLANLSFYVEVSVRVFVPGAEIRGITITGAEFFEKTRSAAGLPDDAFAEIEDSEDGERVSRRLLSSVLYDPEGETGNDGKLGEPATFLHLKNVTVSGNGYIAGAPSKMPLIRIPLAQVTAWALGS